MELGGWAGRWTSQWMTKPGLSHKVQITHELQVQHVNSQEWTGRRVGWPAETAHDVLQPQNRISMHIYNYCNPTELIRWSLLTLLHTWIWDEWSANPTVLTLQQVTFYILLCLMSNSFIIVLLIALKLDWNYSHSVDLCGAMYQHLIYNFRLIFCLNWHIIFSKNALSLMGLKKYHSA